MKGDIDMTDKNDFDMYSNFDNKIPLRKKKYTGVRSNNEEFGSERNFARENSKKKESFSDWIEKMTKEHKHD